MKASMTWEFPAGNVATTVAVVFETGPIRYQVETTIPTVEALVLKVEPFFVREVPFQVTVEASFEQFGTQLV
jgi:hypothetical protein